MRILLLSEYFYPEQMSSSGIDADLFESFSSAGFETIIYTPMPTRGISKKIRREYKRKKYEEFYGGKVKVYRFNLFKEGTNPVQRAFRYTIACIIQFFFAVFSKQARSCDVMFISSTPPIKGAMAALAHRLNKIPYVFNLHDVFPDSLVGAGLARRGGILWKIGRVLENYTYKNAEHIIAVSNDVRRNIMAKGVPSEKITVVYTWVDENTVVPIARDVNPLYEEFGIPLETFNVVYAGNLGNAQNIDLIIDSAVLLKSNARIMFVIFGSGGLEAVYKKRISELDLKNVLFFPIQPRERVSYVYSIGDVCIISCKPGFGGSALPGKTWSIMSAARPIIASFDDGELGDILKAHHCGVLSNPNSASDLAAKIYNMSINAELCEEMGKNGRDFMLRNATKERCTSMYIECMINCIGR